MKYYTYRDNGDYRGFTNSDIQPVNSTTIAPTEQAGYIPNWNGLTWDLVVKIEDLMDSKNLKIEELSTNTENSIISGFESIALGAIHTYQSDRDDQTNLMGLVVSNSDELFKCQDSNGVWSYKLHTVAQLKQVFDDGKTVKLNILVDFNTKKEAILNASTQEELDSIGI